MRKTGKKKQLIQRSLSGILALVLAVALAVPAVPLPARAAGTYHAAIHVFAGDSSTGQYTETVYRYEGASPLVCVIDRGNAAGDYLLGSGSGGYNFFTLSADGSSAVAPKVQKVLTRTVDMETGESSESPEDATVTLSIAPRVTSVTNFGSRYYLYSAYVEGDYQLISFNGVSRNLEDGTGKTLATLAEVALYYLKTGTLLKGCSAYYSSWDSGSFLFGYTNAYLINGFTILSPELKDGAFSSGGLVYAGGAVWGGIQVSFRYSGVSDTYYYRYMLPMSASSYDLRLADLKDIVVSGKSVSLSSVTFTPFVQVSHGSYVSRGTAVTYSAAQLAEAGCFEKGGDPLVLSGNPGQDKNPGGTGTSTKDPWDMENGTGGTGSGGNNKGDSLLPPDIDTDGTEGGFWSNVLNFLKNIATNIANMPVNIGLAVADLIKPLFDKLSEISLGIASQGGEIVSGLEGLSLSIAGTGLDVTAAIAGQGEEIVDAVAGLGLDFAAEGGKIVDAVASVGLDVTSIGAGLMQKGEELLEAEIALGLSVAAEGKKIVDAVAGVGLDVASVGAGLMQKGVELLEGQAALGLSIAGIGENIIDSIKDVPLSIASLMVPREGYLDRYSAEFGQRFPIIEESREIMQDAASRFGSMGQEAPSITVPLSRAGGGKYGASDVSLSFEWFAPYRRDFHTIVSVFMWGIFIFRQYFALKHIFNATSSVPAGFVSSLRGD